MARLFLCVSLLASLLGAFEQETSVQNSNFTLYTPINAAGEKSLYNFNRLRLNAHLKEQAWFVTAIGDIKHTIGREYLQSSWYQAASSVRSDTPFSTQTASHAYSGETEAYAQLYRLYGGYVDEQHRLSIGLQKVSMGVGRIWNPTDLFNPRNPLALEPDEVYGVYGLAYTYAPSRLSEITAVAAQREDESFKYAGRFKGYFGAADLGVDLIYSQEQRMLGYELEGELFDTGIGLRSEGGWIEEKVLNAAFLRTLVGADYAFESSLLLAGEWLHSSKSFGHVQGAQMLSGRQNSLMRSKDYLGVSAGYMFDALLQGSLLGVVSADDGSFYLSPVLSYSLDDDLTLGLGALLYGGKSGSEFGNYGQSGYINLKGAF